MVNGGGEEDEEAEVKAINGYKKMGTGYFIGTSVGKQI